MDIVLPCDHPGRRVLEWLEQCSAAPKDKEHSRVDSDAIKEVNVSHFTSGSDEKIDLDESIQRPTSRQNKNISTVSKNVCSKARHRKTSGSDSGCLSSSTGWRTYSHEENSQIIKYIVDNDAIPFIKGTLLWQKMQKDMVCYRSWQSMKSQFITKIYPHLETYSLGVKDKEKFIECMKPSKQTKFIHMEPGQRGWRKNAKYYTVEEDITILKYISQKNRHLKVHGNSMWQTMEDRQILSERSWQSMRSRYLNVIKHSLDKYELKKHGAEILVNSERNGLSCKKKQETLVSEKPQPCTKTINTTVTKKRNQLRKCAIAASIQLASNLNLYGKTSQSTESANNEVQHTVTIQPQHETPDVKTQAFVDNNASERNSRNGDVASESDIEDANTHTSIGPNFQNCTVETPAVFVNQCCDSTHPFVENNSPKGSSHDLDISVEGVTTCTLPSVPNLEECTVAAPAVSINEVCDDETIPDIENHPIASYVTVGNNNRRNLKNDDIMLRGSKHSVETVVVAQEKCLDIQFMIKNCKMCSSDHKLSPSSN